MKLKEDDIVLCKVKKIEGTTVFLELENGYNGTMVLSEVAAGRIRNIRDYVSPSREVVCKILKVSGKHAELSLRRVTAKERDGVIDKYKKERALRSILKIAGENADEVIVKIKEKYDISDFFDEMKTNHFVVEQFVSKEKARKIVQIISERIERGKEVVARFALRSMSPDGIEAIKEILDVDGEIKYCGSSLFTVRVTGGNFKEANSKLDSLVEEIEKRAKNKGAILELKKGK